VLADGMEFSAHQIASNADPNVTFVTLMDARDLPADFLRAVKQIDYRSASLKINVALSELPDFTALPSSDAAAGPQHRGTIHISPTLDYMERAYDDAKYGRPSASPILECTIPSAVDPSVAPAGTHLMTMFIQYAPYALREGTWDDRKEGFADRCFDILNEYAPNFKRSVIARQVLTPLDIERRFALTGGNIFQGAMTFPQLFFLRPVAGYADYRTPVENLYLCGAATHPGGGVMGACGYNAAREMLRDA
jgi:phytoene dehydrogenase-like protein